MENTAFNCIICADEFNPEDLHNVKLSEINVTRFKICEKCLQHSNPDNDYKEVKDIVRTYIEYSDIKKTILKE